MKIFIIVVVVVFCAVCAAVGGAAGVGVAYVFGVPELAVLFSRWAAGIFLVLAAAISALIAFIGDDMHDPMYP